jgi:hypothetical protein
MTKRAKKINLKWNLKLESRHLLQIHQPLKGSHAKRPQTGLSRTKTVGNKHGNQWDRKHF